MHITFLESSNGLTLSKHFDDKTGSFDGDSPSNSNAHLEIAVSDDNTTFTEFKNFVIGDYTARYLKFRLVLISRDGVTTPVISQATVTVDMEDRIQSGNDIASGATTKTVAGDYFLVESKTINGFNVTFKNASNTVISRTFDYIAKGF